MSSEIQNFYKDKAVFITGGSGFLGKSIIEKLLRTTEVKRIYVFMRPKPKKTIQERVDAWKTSPLFSKVLESQPNAFERITIIVGDSSEPDLGISHADRALIQLEVHVLIHGAATVNFKDPLKKALTVNTLATRLILQLARQMQKLEALVHISTAYSNCMLSHIGEKYYPENLGCRADQILLLHKELSDEQIENLQATLIGKFPNTYTFTKALAEQIIQTESESLPVCVFRPAIITYTTAEPVRGWIDNFNGPIGACFGVALGFLHVAVADYYASVSLVPVDYCANSVLAFAWHTAEQNRKGPTFTQPIYNYAPVESNTTTWGETKDTGLKNIEKNPPSKLIWFPFAQYVTNEHLFKILALFYHLLPGYIFDLILRFQGKKPKLIKLYHKVHNQLNIVNWFAKSSWIFDTNNVWNVWELMSPVDKNLFNFDITSMNWEKYYETGYHGVRTYLIKDEVSEASLVQSRIRYNRFRFYHRILQFTLFSIFVLIVWQLINVVF